jgi:uncharacterized membrane protein YgdD (TMEM256/DUF423 family)
MRRAYLIASTVLIIVGGLVFAGGLMSLSEVVTRNIAAVMMAIGAPVFLTGFIGVGLALKR